MNPFDPPTARRRPSPLVGPAGFDPTTASIGFDPISARPEENKPWTSDLAEIGRQLIGGFAVGVPQQAGQALQWASEPGKPLYETGKRWAQAAEQRAPQWEPDLAGRGPIAETLIKSAQQVGPSVAGPLAATALLAAAPVEVPAAVGLGVGALAGAVPMGMAQGQETYENVLKAGGTPEEALQAGRINQFIETAGETAGNVALGGMLGAGRRLIARGAKPVAEAVKSVTDRSVVKPFLRSTGEALITEPTTEFGQNYGEAAVEQAYGVPNLDPWQQGIEGAKVALGMTALGLPVGAVGHTVQSRRNAAIGEALSNPEAAPERRTRAAEILAGQVDQVDQKAGAAVRANAAEAIASRMPLPIDERIADPKLFLQPQKTAQPGPLADAAAIAQQTGASAQAVLAGMPAGANDEQRANVPAAGAAGGGPAAGTTGNRGRAGTAESGERAGGDGFSLGAGAPAEPAPAAPEGGLGVPALVVDPESGEILNVVPRSLVEAQRKEGAPEERPQKEREQTAARVLNLFGRVDLGLDRVTDELAENGTSPTLERMRGYLTSNLTPYLGEERTAPFIEQLIVGADRDALAQELVQAIGRGRAKKQEKTDVTQPEKERAPAAAAGEEFDQSTAIPVPTPEGVVAAAPSEGAAPVVAKPRLEPEAQNVPSPASENQPPPASAVPSEARGPDQQRAALGLQVPSTAPAEEEPARPTAAGAQTPAAEIPTTEPEITHALEDTETGAADGGRGARPEVRQEGRRPAEGGEGVEPGGQGREIAPEQAQVARPVDVFAPAGENVPIPSAPMVPTAGLPIGRESEPAAVAQQRAPIVPEEAQPPEPLARGLPPAEEMPSPAVAPAEAAAQKNRPSETPVAPRIELTPGVPITQKPRPAVSFVEGDKENTFHIKGNADEIQAALRAAKAPPGTKVDDATVRLNNLARQKAEAVLLPPKGEPIEQGQNQAPQAPIGKTPEPEAEPWQIRRGEFEARPPQRIQREGHEYLFDGTRKVPKYIEQGVKPEAATEIPPSAVHREQVMQALAEGQQVPEDVLADYPEMRGPAPAPEDVTAAWQDEGRKAAIEGRPRLAAQHPGEFVHPDNEAAWLRGYDEAKQPAKPPAAAVPVEPTEPPYGQEETPTETLLSAPSGRTQRQLTEGDLVSWQRSGRKVTARVAKAPDFEGMMDVEIVNDQSRKMKPGFRLRQHAGNVTFEGATSPPSQPSPREGEGVSAAAPTDIEARMLAELRSNKALVEIGKGSQRAGNFDVWHQQSLAKVAGRWLAGEMQAGRITPQDFDRQQQRLDDPEYTAQLGRQLTAQPEEQPVESVPGAGETGAVSPDALGWDAATPQQREAMVIEAGWHAGKDKHVSQMGRQIAARKWADHPENTRQVLLRRVLTAKSETQPSETAAEQVSPSPQPSPIRGEGATGATGLLDTRTADAETGREHLLAGGHIVSRWGDQRQFQEEEWAEEVDRGRSGKTWVRKTRAEGGVFTSGPGPLEAWSKERVVDQIVRARKWGSPEAQGRTLAAKSAQTVTGPAESAESAPQEPVQPVDISTGVPTPPASGQPAAPAATEQEHGDTEHRATDVAGPAGNAGEGAGAVPATGSERRAGELRGTEGRGHAGRVRRTDGSTIDRDTAEQPRGHGAGATGNLAAATDLGRDTGEPSRISHGDDYRIQPGELTRRGSWLETARRNVEAVELIAQLDKEKRAPTQEEQAKLVQFVGWGPGEIRNNLFPPEAGIGKEYRPYYARGEQWKILGERVKEIFSDEDWKTVARSTQYAHYTSEKIIRSIYAALGRLGFAGGSVVEPGAGIGLFAGLMPDAMYQNSTYLGIELDGFSAQIAQTLFPSQTIRHQDYTRQKLPKNFFDLAIGNPPFADVPVLSDPEYRKNKFLLHDYFFAKTIDSVRPGGLLVFITSNGTLDKKSSVARDYLSARADLLGAIRLPQTAFKANAGTEVVTDVLFLRKRDPAAAPAGPEWKDSVPIEVEGTEQFINRYYVAHPEMVLGTHSSEGSMYVRKNYTVKPLEGDIEVHFARAADRLPQNVYSVLTPNVAVKAVQAKTIERDFNPKHRKEGGIYLNDNGDLMRVEFGAGVALADVEKSLSAKDREFLTDYIPLRDALKKAQYDQLTDGDWEASLRALNQAYDAFVAKHGQIWAYMLSERKHVDEDGNESIVQTRRPIHEKRLRMDVEYTLLHALESIKEDGTIEKGPVLTGRVLKQPTQPKIDTISDALAVSLANTGVFDVDHVAQLYGVDRPQAVQLLGDLVYPLPSGGYAMADAYLSGDVKEKLDEAVIAAQHDARFQRNVEALQKAQPPVLGAGDITVQLGAAWIPERYISQFGQEVLGINGARAQYAKGTGQWAVSGRAGKIVTRSGSAEWGTPYRSPTELLDSVLNHRQIRIYDTIEEGGSKKSVFNEKATVIANDLAKRMADEFATWVWTDSRRAADLLQRYNETFNRYSPREFNGDHLNPPGLSLKFKLHPHQKRAVWRQIQDGNVYLAHAVGAGKTLEMIIGGMEQKRLGLINKPMYAVPNHMLQQFAREFMEAYPAANILVADERNFHTDNRRRFVAQAAFNAPDAIVITHSAFKLLQLKPENKAKAYNEILDELRDQLSEVDDSDQMGKRTRREIEKRIERLEQQLEGKSKSETKDTALYFEDLGVDYLYVDEAHAYRKLDFATNMKVKGLSPEGSQQSLDLYAKTRWLDRQRRGRAFTFASGTPITNSMAEMYTVQKFFQEDLMRKEGLHHFDAWASQFGRVAKFYERNATGGIEVVERFGKFVNVYDMMSRALEFMDSLTSPQLAELIKLPDVRPGNAGRRELVSVDQSQNLADYLAGELSRRLEASRKWKPTRDEPNNPDPVIAIIGDGRLAAIDFRFVDPSLQNDPGSKLNRMVDEIIRIYKETADLDYVDPATGEKDPIKGATQIVFASNGFGEAVIRNRGFDSRAWVMRRFKEAGISPQEVAWIWDYKDAAKKEALFKEVRQGKKRILIGSPKNMGTGVNVQRRLLALHHLDAPWYPSDLEQPEGRIVRQGNQNPEVQIYGYATDGTYDSTMWTMVAQKSGFIEQAFRGDRRLRTMDDVSESSQYALAAAIASGDQRYMQLAELEADVTRLEAIRKAHDNRQLSLKRDISNAERDLEWHRKLLETARAVAKALAEETFYSGYLNGKIGDSVFQRGKTTEVGDALLRTFNRAYEAAVLQVQQKAIGSTSVVRHRIDQQVGMLNRVTLRVVGDLAAKHNTKGDIELLSLRSEFDLEASVGDWEIGRLFGRRDPPEDGEEAASKLLTAGREAGYRPPRLERAIGEIKQKLEGYRGRFGAPFAQEQEYLEKLAELEALRKELTAKEEAIDPAAVGDVHDEEEADREAGRETDEEIGEEADNRVEAQKAKYDIYTRDLFDEALPAAAIPETSRAGAEQPTGAAGRTEVGGDLHPAAAVRLSAKVVQTQTGQLTTGFPTIKTWEQAAHTVAQLRKFPQEHFLTLVLDQDQRVIAALRHTIGLRDASQVSPSLVAGSIYAVPGARAAIFAHNHPSGVSQLSTADNLIADKIADLMRDTGIEVWGMIAIGRDKFAYRETMTGAAQSISERPILPARRMTTIPILERIYRKRGRLLDRMASSPAIAIEIARELMGDRTGLLLFDNQHYPIGVFPLAAEDIQTLRGEDGTGAKILQTLHESNAAAAMMVSDQQLDMRDVRNVGSLISQSDVRMLDVINPAQQSSWAESGLSLSESAPYYSRGGAAAVTHHPATLRTALQRALAPYGRDFGNLLLAAPWFHVVNWDAAPVHEIGNEISARFGSGGRPVAYYLPNGNVYLIADHIRETATDADLRGLVLHEIGVHMRHLGQGSKAWANILQQFDAMEQSGNPEIRAAFRRAMLARVPKEMLQEEALAYYIESHPDLPFAKRVLAWFREMLRKIGETFQGLNRAIWMRWANTLSADDLVAMARGALRGVMSDVRVRRIGISKPAFSAAAEPGATTPEIRYSQSPTENPENVFADIDKIIANETPWKEQAKKITERWETLKGAFKRQWLGALSVRQLAEVGKRLLPGIHEYVDHMQGMAATRTQIFDIADKIAKEWGALVPGDKQHNRVEQNRLAAVMHEATLAGVDPAESYVPSIDIQEAGKKIGVLRAQMRSRSGENQSERMAQVASLRQQIAFEKRRKESYEPLRKRFLALTAQSQKIYRRARDYHVDQSHRVEQALVDMIEQSQLSAKAKAEAIGKMRKEFESNRVQAPYFPLSRQGDYWAFLKPKDDGPAEFHMFQTVEQQERFIEEERKAGAKILGRGKQTENLREVVGVSTGFVAEVENLLATMGKDPIVQAARDQVYQLYLATLPDLSVRKHFIHRKKTPGFGLDALRAFAEKAYHDAYQYARLKHGLALRQTMEDLRADIEAANRPAKRKAARQELERLTEFRDTVMGRLTAQDVKNRIVELEGRSLEQPDLVPLLKKWQQFGEWMDDWARRGGMPAFVERRVKVLERRLETGDRINAKERGYEFAANVFDELQAAYGQLMNPRTSPIANMVNQLGFVWFLGFAPSAWLVNGMQTPMFSIPYAAAKFGFPKTAAAFARAYRRAFKPDAENLFSIRGSLQGEELKAYDEAVEIGLIDRTRAHDLAGLAEEGTQRSGINRKLMELASAGFHHAERLNREVTFIAGFELARESGMDYAQAMAYAQELVWKTHLDYAAENRPRLLRGNVARVIGQFKLYSQGITYLLGKSFTDALNRPGVSVETRKEARRFLAMQFGLQFAAAGALGLPVGAALMVAKAMLSGDDDDPEDFEGLFRQAMTDWTGSKTAGTAVSTGLFNALTPIDMHSRLSLADLWLREPDRQLEGRDAAYWVMTSILGPMAGLVESGLVGAKLMNDGQMYRGIEKMLPNALNDAAKGIRYAVEGAQTLKGDKLLQEVTPAESLFQVLGFTPARLEARYAENQARKNVEQRIEERRSQLIRLAAEARVAQDREAIVDTNAEIRAFNEKNPTRRILGTQIAQSIRSRARYRAQAESGAILNPRLRRELTERYAFAGG